MTEDPRTPVDLVTGFLGAGKTTLVNAVLADPLLVDVAVLVNEFGDVGIDHLLVETLDDDTVLLANGCVCCTVRDDLVAALQSLHQRRAVGEIAFKRVLVETSGLADPAPLLGTLPADPALRHQFRMGTVITAVDALFGADQLARHAESYKQVALADHLVITKCDLVSDDQADALARELSAVNPVARLSRGLPTDHPAQALLSGDVADPERTAAVARDWINAEPRSGTGHGVRSVCIECRDAIDWHAFAIWLTAVLHAHGDKVLRVKAVLSVDGAEAPVVLHGVNHMIHPPVHMSDRTFDLPASRIVLLVQDLDPARVEQSLHAALT